MFGLSAISCLESDVVNNLTMLQSNGQHTPKHGIDRSTPPISRSPPSPCRIKDDIDLATHHWTFPVQGNTIYSTSDEEEVNEILPQPVVTTLDKPLQLEAQSSSEDNEWRLEARPPVSLYPSPSANNSSTVPTTSQMHITADIHGEPCASNSQHSSAVVTPAHAIHSESEPVASRFKTKDSPTHTPEQSPAHIKLREGDYGSDDDTDNLLDKQYKTDEQVDITELQMKAVLETEASSGGRAVYVRHPESPEVPLYGILFRSRYMGSTQLFCDGRPTKASRLHQAQEAVNRIKAPDGETQPSVGVELFVAKEKILVMTSNLEEIMMDHNLRMISYIADIGDILVLMARRRPPSPAVSNQQKIGGSTTTSVNAVEASHSTGDQTLDAIASELARTPSRQPHHQPSKILCHVFESDEAPIIAQTIGQAFHAAYLDFLREHGLEDPNLHRNLDYQDVLNQQELFRDDIDMFADKNKEKEVLVPKQRGEALGVVIVESGWGSVLPTAVLANMNPLGPAARCGQLNIGNQIISVNGQSLVGLPLGDCQALIKASRNQTAVKLVVVDCTPVVEVLIRRPDVKYQLGFSVQNGIVCSLLRGGIAERGGIRVDHRIIEINGQSVVAVPHERIVHILATAVGEIYIRTMPSSIFRLLTGQEIPHHI